MDIILFLPVLLFSVVLHEYAHGWMAKRQGDETAYMLGRLTLNPIPHIDLFGSIIFPLILHLSNAGVLFGWAKPVPVNPRNYRNFKRGDILVSLAGIMANLLLAVAMTALIVIVIHISRMAPGARPLLELLLDMARYGLIINLVLAFFNLIPIPPLDGSHVMYYLLPARLGMRYRELGRFGMLILLGLMLLAPNVLRTFLWPVTVLQGWAQALINLWT
ncbi:MAG: site-2 protease family protein [Longimicrobiales bacterium]